VCERERERARADCWRCNQREKKKAPHKLTLLRLPLATFAMWRFPSGETAWCTNTHIYTHTNIHTTHTHTHTHTHNTHIHTHTHTHYTHTHYTQTHTHTHTHGGSAFMHQLADPPENVMHERPLNQPTLSPPLPEGCTVWSISGGSFSEHSGTPGFRSAGYLGFRYLPERYTTCREHVEIR
jgi:hypothetical protein